MFIKRLIVMGGVGTVLCGVGGLRGQEEGPVELPKTAVVNIQELFKEYHKTAEAQRKINDQRAQIQAENNDLVGRLRALDESLRKLTARLQVPDLSDRERSGLVRERGLRFEERRLLDRQRRESLLAKHGDLNHKMVIRMQTILEEIRSLVAEKAEAAGFDLVFDLDGLNSNQVPVVLHIKEATDITPIIMKELKKDAPRDDQ